MNKTSLKDTPITIRSIFITLFLIPFNSYWVLHLSYVWDSNRPTSLALLFNVIFTLLVLMAFNAPLKKMGKRWALTQTELLTVYVMLCQATVFAGRDMVQVLIPLLGNGFWYASLENEWAELFHHHLPGWLVVGDREILQGFYKGESTLYHIEHIHAWLTPVLIWTAFGVLLCFTLFCINVILRKQWQESEKLTYPIAQLPYEMTRMESGYSFFANRLMWLGAGLAAVTNLMYSLHQLFPSVPRIPLYTVVWCSDKPWYAMNNPALRFSFFPFAIGVGFLIPLDLALSCWFFHLFWHFERVIGSIMGWRAVGFPRELAQIRGAWIGLFVFTIWMGRKHFGRIVKHLSLSRMGVYPRERQMFVKQVDITDDTEALRYRTATLGAFIGFALIVVFCVKAGMAFWMATAFFGIYFAMSVAIARIRAELGPPAHDLYNAGPDLILTDTLGTRRIGTKNLSVMTLFFWLNHLSYRAHPMPHQLEALKLAHQTNFNRKHLFIVLLVAVAIGAFSASWGHLHISYQMGVEQGRSWYAKAAFRRLASWAYHPRNTDTTGLWFSAGGFLFAVGLLLMRLRFLWWQLHPVGYIVSSWWTFTGLWFPIFISWAIKRLLLTYGGVRTYRKAVPFFLGLVLGDVIVASTISILGLFLRFRVVYLSW